MSNATNKKSTKDKQVRHTITIDITDCYDRLKSISQSEFRSIEGQCRYFINKGINKDINSNFDIINYQYSQPLTPPYQWDTHPYNLCGDKTVLCSSPLSEKNDETVCAEVKV